MKTSKAILIVEDEPTLVRVLSEKFTSEGYSVLSAMNGKDGLELALEHHPDMILLDIIMPKMDGMTMLKKLHKDAWGKNAQVIMLTNLSGAENIAEAMRQGSYEYLVKVDWTLDDIVEKVKQRLGEGD